MTKPKPITADKIPGTDVPDVTRAPADSEAQKRWMSRVAVTTAILATLASLATMFSTTHLNQAMIEEIKASDQWNFYQAKGIKLAVLESRMELLPALGKTVSEEDRAKSERYQKEQGEISEEAKARQSAAADHRKRQGRLSNASTAFQVSIALAAVALLVKKNVFWVLSILGGCVGVGFFAWGMWPG